MDLSPFIASEVVYSCRSSSLPHEGLAVIPARIIDGHSEPIGVTGTAPLACSPHREPVVVVTAAALDGSGRIILGDVTYPPAQQRAQICVQGQSNHGLTSVINSLRAPRSDMECPCLPLTGRGCGHQFLQ